MSFDWAVFRFLNGLAGRSPLGDKLIQFLMNDYALTTFIVLLLFGLWFSGQSSAQRARNQRTVLSAIASMFLGNIVVKLMNLLYYRFRPFAFDDVTVLFYYPSDSSFPSNATFVGFSIAAALWLYNRTIGSLACMLALLLGVSRVIGGVHFPSDVVGGALIGIGVAYIVVRKAAPLDRQWTLLIGQMRKLLLA
jgi:undecaprenyl-diphosphatase